MRADLEQLAARSEFLHVLEEVTFLSPIPEPRQIRDLSLYAGHIRHARRGMRKMGVRLGELADQELDVDPDEVPPIFRERVIFYFQNRLNVVGHDAEIAWPAKSQVIDFELELGLVVGRTASNISPTESRGMVFGYTIYNDFSARDVQYREAEAGFGPSKAKSFDGANSIGPWIVTADEIGDVTNLKMQVRVNDEIWAETNSAGALHDVDNVLSFLSRDETLYAGEFLGMGTVSQGCGLEFGRYLNRGDTIELWVEKIGFLRNSIKQ